MKKFVFTLLVLVATIALADGSFTTGVRVSKLYINSPGTVVRIDTSASVVSPGGTSCSGSGYSFNPSYAVFVPDYSSTAKSEATKQIVNALNAAYLSGRNINFFSPWCVTDPWDSSKRVAFVYDIHLQ